ncbi:MAG: hypothetical protein JOZ43_04680 [Acidobacteriales bacterium]|nr:hypothetical protein [Terriglobales bacterium]
MPLRVPPINFGLPQLYAALLLLLFATQALWIVENTPPQPTEFSTLDCGRAVLHLSQESSCSRNDSALSSATAAAPFLFVRTIEQQPTSQLPVFDLFRFAPWTRTLSHLPFVAFGLWLGGGLWWVARRLFGTAGGVLALALYCTSPWILRAATTLSPEIIAAWGFFGAIYTSIGIGHTILAPLREWRFRILLLGAALAFTASAVPTAGWLALAFSCFFLLYLSEDRRPHAITTLCAAALIAALLILLLSAGHMQLLATATPRLSASWILRFFSQWHDVPLYALAAIALAVFLGWRRARYFGNWSPLLVAIITPFLASRWTSTEPLVWSLPFLYVFIAGVFADLFESSLRKFAIPLSAALVLANAALGWRFILHSVELLQTVGRR